MALKTNTHQTLDTLCNVKDYTMHFIFSNLTGQYTVGTTTRHVITNYQDPHNPEQAREVMIRLWYPCQTQNNDQKSRYPAAAVESAQLLNPYFDITEDLTSAFNALYTHAFEAASPAHNKKPFPLLIFSHGYIASVPELYSYFCQELASHGYVVVGIAHTYYAGSVIFPSGQKITFVPEKFHLMKTDFYKEPDQEIWKKDTQSVMHALTTYNTNPDDCFYTLLDLDHCGIFGHSFGGLVAYQALLKDSRFKAGISLDGVSIGRENTISEKPFLFLIAEGSAALFAFADDELAQKYGMDKDCIHDSRTEYNKVLEAPAPIMHDIIDNIQHSSFSDFLLLKDLPFYKNNQKLMSMMGTAPGEATAQIIAKKLLNFFNNVLK